MSFSDNAIGFYLEIEDSSFSSTLKRATKTYDSYVKALERYNERAFKSTSSALAKIEDMVETVRHLPEHVTSSMRKAAAGIARAIKPITAKVNLDFTVSSERRLSKVIGQAVADALGGAKLRLTQGKRMKMTPDLVGRFDLPRFEEGGIVKGPNKAFDSVMALLKPGELVLPTEITKQLTEMAGQLRAVGGKFTKASGLTQTLADVENLSKGLTRLRGALEQGLADPKEIKTYNTGVELLASRVKDLDNETLNLAYSTKVRLAPAIEQARGHLAKFQEQGKESEGVFDRLFGKILGPARFMAMRTALSDLTELWRGVKESGVGIFDNVGGTEIKGAIDNINRMNVQLGLTREQLSGVKAAAFEAAAEMGGAISVDQLTAAMADLADQGIKDTRVLLDLGKTTALAAEGLGLAASNANAFGVEVTRSIGLSNAQLTGMFANLGRLTDQASGFNVTAQELFGETEADIKSMGAALRQMSTQDAERSVETLNRLGAALHNARIEDVGGIRQTLAKAFEGGPENIEAMQQAFLLTGKTQDQLREAIKSGNIEGLFDSIAKRVDGLTTDQLTAFAEQVGVTAVDLQRFSEADAQLNADLSRSKTLLMDNANSMGVLEERATQNKTAFQQGITAFGNWFSNLGVFGFKVADATDLLKEFNLAQIASIAYLAKTGVEAVASGIKLAKNFGSVLGGIAKTTATVATTAVSGVGTGGMFAAIGAGLTAVAGGVATLGAVLLSPPGIAFTVSFIAALLAMGFALNLASPAIKVWGDVAIKVLDGVVTAFGMFMPVLQSFIGMVGNVLVAVIAGAVEAFKALLDVDAARLFLIGPALASIAGGVVVLAGALGVLGAVQFGSAVLGFLTGGAAASPTGFLDALISSVANLSISSPDQVKTLTATVNNLGGFVLAYARLVQTVDQLPKAGLFDGLFGGEDAADKLTAQAGPFLAAVEALMSKTSAVQDLQQPSRVPPIPSDVLEQTIAAELARDSNQGVEDKLDTLIDLMRVMVEGRARQVRPASPPSNSAPGAPRAGSPFTRDLASGDY